MVYNGLIVDSITTQKRAEIAYSFNRNIAEWFNLRLGEDLFPPQFPNNKTGAMTKAPFDRWCINPAPLELRVHPSFENTLNLG